MKYIAHLIIAFCLFGVSISCSKTELNSNGKLYVYPIENFTTEPMSDVIQTFTLSEYAIIKDKDILSYNSKDFSFKINHNASKELLLTTGLYKPYPFAVVLDKEVIYTGYFWPSTLSKSCDWLVSDPILVKTENIFKINLGYPESVVHDIKDLRSNNRLSSYMRESGRLSE